MTIEDFRASDWIKIWAGQWSFLTCSYWAVSYSKDYVINGKVFLHRTVFFFEEGKSSCFMTQSDRDEFGKNLASELISNPNRATEIATEFRKRTDEILGFIALNINSEMSKETFDKFWSIQDAYYKPHINIKYVTDYLPAELLKKFLPQFEEVRLHAEPVFKRTEEFITKFAEIVAKKVAYSTKHILHVTKDELNAYFAGGNLPAQEVLEERYKKSSIFAKDGVYTFVAGDPVKDIEKVVFVENKDQQSIKGMTAYPGKTSGIVRIVLDPAKVSTFNDGDILVTGMTRPEYLQLMHKAAAFVTDAGGILSHAAIVARELKKPCVIGTKDATKVLKDGMRVEVDAEKGVVKIIK